MTTVTFDTHEIIKKLREKGLSEELAEYQVEAMKEVARQAVVQVQHDFELDDLATKRDLRELELMLKRDLSETKADLQRWIITVVLGVGVLQTAIITALVLKVAQ